MERTIKEIQSVLYSTNLENLEKNLDDFLEAKHEHLKEKQNTHFHDSI